MNKISKYEMENTMNENKKINRKNKEQSKKQNKQTHKETTPKKNTPKLIRNNTYKKHNKSRQRVTERT